MTQQKLTAAEQYARQKADVFEAFLEESFQAKALKGVDLYEVKCPSGFMFKCRRPDAMVAAQIGQMPMALSASVLGGETPNDASTNEEWFAGLSPMERAAALAATAKVVRYIAVEPRLVMGEVTDQTNAISVDMLTIEDFNHLALWSQNGGGAAAGLKTFRRKGR